MKTPLRMLVLAGLTVFALAAQAQNAPAPADPQPAAPNPGAVAPPDVTAPVAPEIAVPAPTTVVTSMPLTVVTSAPLTVVTSAPLTVVTSAPLTVVTSVPLTVATSAPPAVATSAPLVVATPAADPPPPPGTGDVVPLIVIDDVPLLDAVKNLARQAGLNFQFDPRVNAMSNQPNVTIRFENVTAEDALGAVLDNYGLAAQHDLKKRISRITIKEPKAEEPLVSKVIQLKYTSPSNIVSLLQSTLSSRSQVLPDPRTSQILVRTTEREMVALEEMLPKLDKATRQVLIEAQLWETTKSPQSIKGIDWTGTLQGNHITFGNGNTTGTTTTTAPGTPTTTTLPGGRTISTTPPFSTASSLVTAVGGGGMGLNTASGFSPATAFLNSDGLSAVVSFLNSDTDTELVATPRAVTLDNEMAHLDVSRAYPIWNVTPGSANSPAGSQVIYTNIGVILSVTPRISADDQVALHIVPEVSDIAAVDKQVINGQTFSANIYGVRRVEAHVVVRSGSTLVMGGLLNDHASKGFIKVPILGDLPGLGMLFRQDSKTREKTDLMIFVTPTIIDETAFQANKPSQFLKRKFQPSIPEGPESAWDSGKPYDWTKPKNTTAAAQ